MYWHMITMAVDILQPPRLCTSVFRICQNIAGEYASIYSAASAVLAEAYLARILKYISLLSLPIVLILLSEKNRPMKQTTEFWGVPRNDAQKIGSLLKSNSWIFLLNTPENTIPQGYHKSILIHLIHPVHKNSIWLTHLVKRPPGISSSICTCVSRDTDDSCTYCTETYYTTSKPTGIF